MKHLGFNLSIVFCLLLSGLTVLAADSPAKPVYKPPGSTNIYWINLKRRLKEYLSNKVDSSLYKYEILEPKAMKNFLGNVPNAKVSFSGPSLNTRSHKKVVYAKSGSDNIAIAIKVWKYKDLWVATKAIKRGQEIPRDLIKKQRRSILQRDERLFFMASPERNIALTNIEAGTALKINMLRHAKAVQPGDIVTVEVDSNFINIQFKCKAFNSADPGETVNLSCPDMRNKSPQAIVVAPGRARLRS